MPVTIEAIQARQTELAAMIQALQEQANEICTYIEIEETTIELRAGERYAGAVLDEDGDHQFHLVLMAQRPAAKLNWQAAMEWAQGIGGSIPTRQEQALLYANCKPHLKPEWHWSSESYESDASFAWYCHFLNGYQGGNHKSAEGAAVAVRRV